MLKFVEKLHLEKYVSSKLILGLDIFISIMMSVFALFLTELLFVSFSYEFLMLLSWLGCSCLSSVVLFLLLKTHKSVIRHSTLRELWKLGVAVVGKGVAMALLVIWFMPSQIGNVFIWTALLFDVFGTISALVAVRVAMIIAYDAIRNKQRRHEKCKDVLVYGVS